MPCLHPQVNDVLKDVFEEKKDVFGYSKCQNNLDQLCSSEISPIFVFWRKNYLFFLHKPLCFLSPWASQMIFQSPKDKN